jgi:hypothetical protein
MRPETLERSFPPPKPFREETTKNPPEITPPSSGEEIETGEETTPGRTQIRHRRSKSLVTSMGVCSILLFFEINGCDFI